MKFNVNDGVVKMLELLASNKSLQAFIVILAIIIMAWRQIQVRSLSLGTIL